MSRELDDFRDNLALLRSRFPDKDMLTAKDCTVVFGCSLPTVYRIVPFGGTHRISLASLARLMCARRMTWGR